jgi:aspartate-semialdehyde dehydrogenase
VPVVRAHAEAIHAEFERPVTEAEARAALAEAPGVASSTTARPTASRCRSTPAAATTCWWAACARTPASPARIALFLAGDQIRKGAALNAVQIAERL